MQQNKMHSTNIKEICQIFQSNNPHPKTELNYQNHYTLLVAIILSAQATDVGVNKATSKLFQKILTPEQMLELGLEKLKHHIKTIGLYNSKALNVIKTSQILVSQYNSQIPTNREELMKLPGVGRKTANVFLNCAFGQETIGVDTHVHRVSNRLGLVKSNNVLETEIQLDKKIKSPYKKDIHHWLILHGRYICKARNPSCSQCQISKYCQYFQQNINS